MAQQVRRRHQKNITYEENSKTSELLGRGMVYRELYFKLRGQIDVANTENIIGSMTVGNEWGVVKRIEIIANNTDVLRSISGNQLWWLNYFMYGNPPHVEPGLGDYMAGTTAQPGTADPDFASWLIMPFWMPRSLRPMDTALDARELSDLKVEITWGDPLDVVDPITAPAWITEPVLEVHSLESFNVSGPFSQWRIFNIQKEITANNTQFQVILPVGPLYRGFIINTTGLYTAGAGVNKQVDDPNILLNLKIKSGTTIFTDVPASCLRQIDSGLRSSIPQPYASGAAQYIDAQAAPEIIAPSPGGGFYDYLRRGPIFNNQNAWYYYDHVTDGFLTESIDTLGFSEFELELDVLLSTIATPFTTQINIMPLQIIPVRG